MRLPERFMDPNVDVEVVMWSITVLVSLYDALRV